MQNLDPRIRTALVTINPTSKNPAWHGAPTPLGILRGMNATVATWRPYAGANNVRELALHIGFWENSVANRLGGQAVRMSFEQRKTSWPVRVDSVGGQEWKDEVGLVRSAHERLVEAVSGFDPTRLDMPAGKQTNRNAVEYIHGVGEHSLYHTAAMKMIRALAGTLDIGENG